MKNRPVTFLIATVIVGLLACGCGSDTQPQEGVGPGSNSPATGPFRLTREYLAEQQEAVRQALLLRLDGTWEFAGAARGAFAEESLRLEAGEHKPVMQRQVDIKAEQYNELRVRMKVDKGSTCRVNWRSDVEPTMSKNPGVTVPIFADNEFHTYSLPLVSLTSETWYGRIREIRFFPSDEPANIEIVAMEFAYRPPEGPRRVTIGNETREVLAGTKVSWTLMVPSEATFAVNIGMAERSWKICDSDGARFKAVLDAGSGAPYTLVDRALTPSAETDHREWTPVHKDLARFAGEEVTITFSVGHLDTSAGDYAYWGSPIIYSRDTEGDATPVVLVSCDTLRADHLSCYGYGRQTSPYLDAWAKEAVLFENAIVQDAWTLPSHATMLTGMYPKNHGVTPNSNLAEEAITLPELLGKRGYLTAGYTGIAWWLEPWRGFSHGFDVYNTPAPYRSVFATNELVYRWLGSCSTDRFFLFVHNYDIHSKSSKLGHKLAYVPDDPALLHFANAVASPPRFEREGMDEMPASDFLIAANRRELTVTQEEVAYLISLYDDCIRAVDRGIHDLFECLRDRGVYDNALIIVTADHGEAFGEHRLYMHEDAYEHCTKVPLLVKFPNGRFAGRRVSDVVQLTDLFPTVLNVLDIPAQVDTDGQDLVAVLEGAVEPRPIAYTRRHSVDAVRTNKWKLMKESSTGKTELYNIVEDPNEQNNVIEDTPPVLAGLDKELRCFYRPKPDGWHLAFSGRGQRSTVDFALTTDDRQNCVARKRK